MPRITRELVDRWCKVVKERLHVEVENGNLDRAYANVKADNGNLSIDVKMNIGEGKNAPFRIGATISYSLEKAKSKGSFEFNPDQPELDFDNNGS